MFVVKKDVIKSLGGRILTDERTNFYDDSFEDWIYGIFAEIDCQLSILDESWDEIEKWRNGDD